jgi:hypothetical protein
MIAAQRLAAVAVGPNTGSFEGTSHEKRSREEALREEKASQAELNDKSSGA